MSASFVLFGSAMVFWGVSNGLAGFTFLGVLMIVCSPMAGRDGKV